MAETHQAFAARWQRFVPLRASWPLRSDMRPWADEKLNALRTGGRVQRPTAVRPHLHFVLPPLVPALGIEADNPERPQLIGAAQRS